MNNAYSQLHNNTKRDIRHLLLLTKLATDIARKDSMLAQTLALEAGILSYVLEGEHLSLDIAHARARAFLTLAFCEECSTGGNREYYIEEACSLLSVLPPTISVRVLLVTGQLYQNVKKYYRARHFFQLAEQQLTAWLDSYQQSERKTQQ